MFWGRHPRLAGRVLQGLRVLQKSTEGTPGSLGLLYWGKLWKLVKCDGDFREGRGRLEAWHSWGGATPLGQQRQEIGLVPGGAQPCPFLSIAARSPPHPLPPGIAMDSAETGTGWGPKGGGGLPPPLLSS